MVISLFVFTGTHNIFSTSFSGMVRKYYDRTICCLNINFSANFNFIVPKGKFDSNRRYIKHNKIHKTHEINMQSICLNLLPSKVSPLSFFKQQMSWPVIDTYNKPPAAITRSAPSLKYNLTAVIRSNSYDNSSVDSKT